jgi:hypothetical protein
VLRKSVKPSLAEFRGKRARAKLQDEVEEVIKRVKLNLGSLLAPPHAHKDRRAAAHEDLDREIELIERRRRVSNVVLGHLEREVQQLDSAIAEASKSPAVVPPPSIPKSLPRDVSRAYTDWPVPSSKAVTEFWLPHDTRTVDGLAKAGEERQDVAGENVLAIERFVEVARSVRTTLG